MSPASVWLITAVLALAGAAGVFLPVLPGTPLILAAAVFNKVMLPQALSWWTVGGLALLCILGEWDRAETQLKLSGQVDIAKMLK